MLLSFLSRERKNPHCVMYCEEIEQQHEMNTEYLCWKKKMNNDKMHINGDIKWLWRVNMQTYWIWKLILARSNGAITVLATPPANAPQNKFITTVFTFDGIESGNVVFNEIFPNVVNYYGKFSNTYVCRL